jgi:hypothetical protein
LALNLQFETSDLFAAKNLQLVLQHLGALHNFVTKHNGSLKEKAESVGSGKIGASGPAAKRTPTKSGLSASTDAAGSKNSAITSSPSRSTTSRNFGTSSPGPGQESSSSSPISAQSKIKTAPSVASLAADIATKEEFKYNPEVEAAAQRWIEKVLGIPPTGLSFFSFLKSGVILCQVANKIQPQIVPQVYEGGLPYRQMENIGWYITACQQLGLKDVELFETADLFAERNLNAVANHIHVLAHWLVKRPGWQGPPIEDVRDAKSLFSATLVDANFEKIGSSAPASALTEQQKELLGWANSKLVGITELADLSGDVKNGVKLIQLLDAICRGQSLGIYNATPTLIWHAMQNASAILSFVASQTFEKVDGVRAVDIVTGNVSAVAKLLFYLRSKFDLEYLFAQTLGEISSSFPSVPADAELLEVEILEGEEVPEHLRPLMSPEDLQLYDRLARERKEEDARLALLDQDQASSSSSQAPTIPVLSTTPTAMHTEPEVSSPGKRTNRTTSTATPPSTTPEPEPSPSGKTRRPSTSGKRKGSISKNNDTSAPAPTSSPHVDHRHAQSIPEEVDGDLEVEVVEEAPAVAPDRVRALTGDSVPVPKPSSTIESDEPSDSISKTTSSSSIGSGSGKRRDKKPRDKSGASSPKLSDSTDGADAPTTPTKTKRTKGSKKDKPRVSSTEENSSEMPELVAPVPLVAAAVQVEPPSKTPEPEVKATETSPPEKQPADKAGNDSITSMNSSQASLNSSTGSSVSHGSIGNPMTMRQRSSHTRERSIPRRINIKRTATFGANTVDMDKLLRAQQVVRKHVATETLTTEQSYLNSLQTLIRDLLEPIKRSKVITTDEFQSIFSNIEQIASDHVRFEQMLRARIGNWEDASILSDIFLKETSFFRNYGPYLANFSKGAVALHYIRKKHLKFDNMIKAFEDELMKTTMATLDSFLIMPVQRLPRYRLLLSDLRKYTPQSWQEHLDLETAVNEVDRVLHELNSHIDKDGAEQIKKLLLIESSIQGEFQIMKPDRKFVREGALTIKKLKPGDKTKPEKKKLAERVKGMKAYFFLFNDLLVICEPLKQAKSDDKCQFSLILAYHLGIPLVMSETERSDKSLDQIANFTIKKHPDKKYKDVIVYIQVESDLIVVQANTVDDRDSWMKVLQPHKKS